jgi:GGDEF domain-containing protein
LTVSSGVAVWPLHGTKLATVIEAANGAESAAKRAGKNRVHLAQDVEQTIE